MASDLVTRSREGAPGRVQAQGADIAPGKRTLVERAAVHAVGGQADERADERAEVHTAAAHGAATPPRAPRYAGPIQDLFGHRGDASSHAHVGSDETGTPPRHDEGRAGGRLNDATRDRMESSFGVGFGDVNVHADSPRASGSTAAFTEGRDLHFAPGKYDPGSPGGDWLIAHELAHVVQQRGAAPSPQRFDPGQPGLEHEAEADRAADAAVSGGKAEVQLSARAGARQAYEAWEHQALADWGGGADRTIMLKCGIPLTYGQVAALSGDHYRSPEELMHTSRERLEKTLRTIERERKEAGVTPGKPFGTATPAQPSINSEYEMASTDPKTQGHIPHNANPLPHDTEHAGGPDADHPHGRLSDGTHVEDSGSSVDQPSQGAGFYDGADKNNAHFATENIELNFIPKHKAALDLARNAWQRRNPGAVPGTVVGPKQITQTAAARTAEAAGGTGAKQPGVAPIPGGASAGAPHPKKPAPNQPVPIGAATPTESTVSTNAHDPSERDEAMAYVFDGFATHYLGDAFAAGHLISGSVVRKLGDAFYKEHNDEILGALMACLVTDTKGIAGITGMVTEPLLQLLRLLLKAKAGSLALKIVHDHFNQHGLLVRNRFKTWKLAGDSNLAGSPDTQWQAGLAIQASREAVEKTVQFGALSGEERDPLDFVPSHVRFGTDTYLPIAEFSRRKDVFELLLSEKMLSHDPQKNELWQLIKRNAIDALMLQLKKGGRSAVHLAKRAPAAALRAAETLGNAPARAGQHILDVGRNLVNRAASWVSSWFR